MIITYNILYNRNKRHQRIFEKEYVFFNTYNFYNTKFLYIWRPKSERMDKRKLRISCKKWYEKSFYNFYDESKLNLTEEEKAKIKDGCNWWLGGDV